jgi:hypothetical protein
MLFEGKKYEKPEEGVYDAVLADIENLGIQQLTYEGTTKSVPMCRFVYFLDAADSEGRQFRLTERFSIGFHKKNSLVKRLANFGLVGVRGFDSDQLVGTTGRLMVVHNGDFANVSKFTPKAGLDVYVPEGFKRAPETPVAEEAA